MSYFKLEAFPSENHPLWKEKKHVLIKKNPKPQQQETHSFQDTKEQLERKGT